MRISTKRCARPRTKTEKKTKKSRKWEEKSQAGDGKCKAFVELLVGGKWQENDRRRGRWRTVPWNRKMAAKLTSELYYLYLFSLFLFIYTEEKN